VELDIIEVLHPLVRTDSLATIETEGLVGGNYLGITTGSDTAAVVAPNATIAGKEPIDIAELVQRMGDTVTKVNDTIDAMRDDVQRAVVAVADTVNNANARITDVGVEVKKIAASGARITDDAAQIADGIRSGKGTVGKLVTDDELYNRITAIARQTEETTAHAKDLVESAKEALAGLNSKDGAVLGMTASVRQTMDDARASMAGFADNMDALKHNFLLRGFFKGRGYFDLAQMSPADYRQGALTKGGDRGVVRVWLRADTLLEAEPDHPGSERLTDVGKTGIEAAIAPYLEYVASGIVMVEGYAQQGPRDQQYLRSRARASIVREYLIGKFHLDPQATGAMPLGAQSAESPAKAPWDGVALAVILPKDARATRGATR
jgi:phospholipid/cholesterol/gamma-HCH transport system substrate-binding protein